MEGVLPDGLTGRIQDQQMLPYFKQGQYEKGIVQGYLTVATTEPKVMMSSWKACVITAEPSRAQAIRRCLAG